MSRVDLSPEAYSVENGSVSKGIKRQEKPIKKQPQLAEVLPSLRDQATT